MNGNPAGSAMAFLGVLAMGLAPAAVAQASLRPSATTIAQQGDELERLRGMLQRGGADGREAREQAVERLLSTPTSMAQRLLQDALLQKNDPDALRATILTALQRHCLGQPERLFGGAGEQVRAHIVHGYLVALSPWWADETVEPALRTAARTALQRLPARDVEAAARSVIGSGRESQQTSVLRCLADLQQTLFAPLIAESLAASDERLRTVATAALQSLLYPELPLRRPEEFQAYWREFGSLRYVDFAERAARRAMAVPTDFDARLARVRREADRDVVKALVERSGGIDWAAVQARTVVDDAEVRNDCLTVLRQSLQAGPSGEDSPGARQAFARALLQKHRQLASGDAAVGALLLEVAAYVTRAEEVDLAAELVGLLQTQLEANNAEARLGALRGLRRFPAPEARARLVQLGKSLLADEAQRPLLLGVLTTLASRTAPRWMAPAPADGDKVDWLLLIATCARVAEPAELREQALLMTQALDGRDQRVPEVFDLLVGLVRDGACDAKLRAACVIQLQGWRNDGAHADEWVRVMHATVADPLAELRRQAADSLSLLTSSTDARRGEWMAATIPVLRGQLRVEADVVVLRDLVDCLQVLGREPQMPEKAIGALLLVLQTFVPPVSLEQQARLEPLLQALTTIAADPVAGSQWVAACPPLLLHRKRQSLRLIMQNHAAADLAKDVDSADAAVNRRARLAMQFLIDTAMLKPAREGWTTSEDLVREVRDVRAAFGAIDGSEEMQAKDSAALRILRLEVDLASGKYQDVVQRATTWLGNGSGATNGANGARAVLLPEDLARIRVLAAEAQLALGRPEPARRLVEEALVAADPDATTVDLMSRIGRALAATDSVAALTLFDRVIKATSTEDVTFRARLLDQLQTRLRVEPDASAEIRQRAETYAPLFAAPECPAELRDAFANLRAVK